MMKDVEFESLTIGDKVLFSEGGWHPEFKAVTVLRKTATQALLSNGTKINKRGHIVGAGTWSRQSVFAFDQQVFNDNQKELHQRRECRFLAAFDWKRLSDDARFKVMELAKAAEQESNHV